MDPLGLRAKIDDIHCLAIGTGYNLIHAAGWRKRGALGWVQDVIDLTLEQQSAVTYQAERILNGIPTGRFRAINPMLDQETKLDDVKSLPYLEKIAHSNRSGVGLVAQWISSTWATPLQALS